VVEDGSITAACRDSVTIPLVSEPHPVVARAAALAPRLLENARRTEQAQRVLPEHFDALAEAGIFRMAGPKKYGGDEVDFQTQCDVLAHLARGCPSTSWVATILSAMAWLAGTFPDEAQEEILGTRDPRISGVFSPTGTATPVDGGYRVSGRWGFNTGGQGSDWTVLHAVEGQGESATSHCVIVRTTELSRLDDWHASGMAGTGSHTVVADHVFVPAHRAASLVGMLNAAFTTNRHNAANPFFNLPMAAVLTVNGGGTPVGIAQGAREAFLHRLPGRGITYTTYAVQAAAAITHLQVGEASLLIDSADSHVRRATALLDDLSALPLSTKSRVKARGHVAYATGLARQAVDILFHGSGASAIQPHVPIQRFQRDMQALANHAVMHAPTGIELYGRVLCGLEPNTLLY
jgi:alkylation response protein AidB-like acyl-CoA dehydrogenase